ncbi:MAG: hypothetical protein KKA79_01285 [Nanoarchaeota archaeon]|nr:hypothetical protein [Nanoarchaeota archaeon]
MAKFYVDFELAGHIEVEAENEQEAQEVVEATNLDMLINYIQNFNVGKNYIAKEME